jgi:hypothetical protein
VVSTRFRATLARIARAGHLWSAELGELDGAVIVAVIAVLVVQVRFHHVVEVISVRHREVTTGRAVDMRPVVPAARVRGSAARCVGAADRERVLIDVVTVHVVQVPIMEVIDVILMPHSRVAAVRAVLVGVIFVSGMIVHGSSPVS